MTTSTTELETNPAPAGAAEGVQGTNPAAEEADGEGVRGSDEDQGQADQSDDALSPEVDDDAQQGAQTEDLDEIEHEGKKYAIPKAIKPLLLMQADYTQKTQEHAERVREDEARITQERQALQVQAQFTQAHTQLIGQLAATDHQLGQYSNVNWQQWMATDPQSAQAAWMQASQLKEQRAQLVGALQQGERQFAAQANNLEAQRKAREAQAVAAVVSKWSPEVRAAVNDIGAKAYGISDQQFSLFASNPALLTVLHDAVQYRQLMTKTASVTKPKAAAQPIAPTATLPKGGGQATPKRLDSPGLSTEEWMSRRNEQLSRTRRR